MADGKITIDIEVNDKKVGSVHKTFEQFGGAAKKAGDDAQKGGKGVEEFGDKAKKADSRIRDIIKSLGLMAIAQLAFKAMKQHLDAAISRFDKLKTMPRVIEQLGADSDDAQRSFKRLASGIEGLPTTLDDIAQSMQIMFTIFKDADKATDSALALNNALLASGTAGGEATAAADRYVKVLQTGKVDMITWVGMQKNMSVALDQVAESMGITMFELGEGLREGSIKVQDFHDKLIELGTGTGKLASLATTMTEGIQTSLTNLGTAVTKGLANIIEKIDDFLRDVTGKGISEWLDTLKGVVNSFFGNIRTAIDTVTPLFKVLFSAFKTIIEIAQALEPVLWGVAAAFLAYKVITQYGIAIQKAATLVWNLITSLITAEGAVATFQGALGALKVALGGLAGPLGWIALIIGEIVAGVAVWKKVEKELNKALDEHNEYAFEYKKSLDDAKDSLDFYTETVEKSKRKTEADTEARRNNYLMLLELMGVEKKDAATKKHLQELIDELNKDVDGLNISYDEQRDKLTKNTEVVEAYIEAQRAEDELNAIKQRGIDLDDRRLEMGQMIGDMFIKRSSNYRLWTDEEEEIYQQAIKTYEEYTEAIEQNTQDQISAREKVNETVNRVVAVEEEAAKSLKLTYQELTDEAKSSLKEMADHLENYRGKAQDIFSKIEIDTSLTFKDIMTNLEHNKDAVAKFMTNIGELIALGVDEHFVQDLIHQGPAKAAGVAAEILKEAKARPESINALNTAWREAGEAAEGIIDVYEAEIGPISEAAKDIIAQQEETMFERARTGRWTEVAGVVLDQFGDGLYDPAAWTRIKSASAEVVDEAGDAMGKEVPKAGFDKTAGQAIDGWVSGWDKNKYKALNSATSLVNEVNKTLKNNLKISSPSQVMANEIGRFIPAGIGLGIKKYGKTLFEEIDEIVYKMERMFGDIRLPIPDTPDLHFGNPEFALGASMAHAGRIPTTTSRTIANTPEKTNVGDVLISGNHFIVREEADIHRIALELENLRLSKVRA